MERRENKRKSVRINEDATIIYSIIPDYKIKERESLRIEEDKQDGAISDTVTPNYQRGHNLTKDLSIGGIRFFSNSFIPLNSILKVEIKLKYVPRVVSAIVELVWIKGIFEDEFYEAGAKFIDINKGDLLFLNSYLSSKP